MRRKALRPGEQCAIEFDQCLRWRQGRLFSLLVMTIQAICIFLLKGLQTGISLAPGFLEDGKSLLLHRLDFLLRNAALLLQATRIDFAYGWMRTDDLVHLWLREGGFVALVVSPAAVAYQVDKNIFMKLVAVGMSHTHRHQRSIWIIGIHVDHGDFKTFR